MSFEVVYNTALKIYSKLFVGIKPEDSKAKDKGVPLGFATPYTEDAAGLKRQSTVKNWVGSSRYDYATRKSIPYEPDLRVLENKPRTGWKITDDVKRVYWGGGNVVWRLEDPLGYEIEIQSSNLMAIIQACGISAGGVIEGECILARDGAHNVLLPVTSQEYKDAIKAAEGIKMPSKVPMKDRVIGRTYRLLDGTFGTYLGKHYVSTQQYGDRDSHYSGARGQLSFTVPGIPDSFVVETETSSKVLDKESEQFEGVYVDEVEMYPGESYSYKKGGQTKYYKSAPLIAELDQKSFDVEAGVTLANSNDMVWASSAKSGMPCMAALVPHVQLKYATRPITEAKFKELRPKIWKQAKQDQQTFNQSVKYWNEHKSGTQPTEPKYTIAQLFSHYGDGVMLQDGDKIYDAACGVDLHQRAWSYARSLEQERNVDVEHRVQVVLGRMNFTDYGYCLTRPKQYHATVTRVTNRVDHIEPTTIVLQKFDTVEAMMENLDKQFAAGRIVEKFITIKE